MNDTELLSVSEPADYQSAASSTAEWRRKTESEEKSKFGGRGVREKTSTVNELVLIFLELTVPAGRGVFLLCFELDCSTRLSLL